MIVFVHVQELWAISVEEFVILRTKDPRTLYVVIMTQITEKISTTKNRKFHCRLRLYINKMAAPA